MKKLLTISFVLIFLFTGCIAKDTQSNESSTFEEVSKTDKQSTEGSSDLIPITFGQTIISNEVVQVQDNSATITKSGDYKITGSSTDGQLIINAPEEEVNITLEDLDLTSSNTSAITVIDAKSLNITLSGENTLSDTTSNTEDYQAPLFIDEVETHISGDGILNLNGNYQEGLESNNDLYVDGGILNITAIDDGINTGDLLSINGGEVNIDSNGDGLDSNGDLEITGGVTYVSGGNNGNGPIDYGEGYSFTLTGGTVVAVGGNMGTTPTEQGQTFLTASTSGTTVETEDVSYDSPKDFSYMFISYEGLQEDTEVLVDESQVSTSSQIQESSMGMSSGMGRPF